MQGDDATADDGGQTADASAPDETAATAEATAEVAAEATVEETGPDPSTDGRPPFDAMVAAFTKADEDEVAFDPEGVSA